VFAHLLQARKTGANNTGTYVLQVSGFECCFDIFNMPILNAMFMKHSASGVSFLASVFDKVIEDINMVMNIFSD
jgi:hypothetical protein